MFHADRVTDEQTDRHDEANSRFSKFCGLTYKRPRTLPRVTGQYLSNAHMNGNINLIVIYEVSRGDYEPSFTWID